MVEPGSLFTPPSSLYQMGSGVFVQELVQSHRLGGAGSIQLGQLVGMALGHYWLQWHHKKGLGSILLGQLGLVFLVPVGCSTISSSSCPLAARRGSW